MRRWRGSDMIWDSCSGRNSLIMVRNACAVSLLRRYSMIWSKAGGPTFNLSASMARAQAGGCGDWASSTWQPFIIQSRAAWSFCLTSWSKSHMLLLPLCPEPNQHVYRLNGMGTIGFRLGDRQVNLGLHIGQHGIVQLAVLYGYAIHQLDN